MMHAGGASVCILAYLSVPCLRANTCRERAEKMKDGAHERRMVNSSRYPSICGPRHQFPLPGSGRAASSHPSSSRWIFEKLVPHLGDKLTRLQSAREGTRRGGKPRDNRWGRRRSEVLLPPALSILPHFLPRLLFKSGLAQQDALGRRRGRRPLLGEHHK